MPEQDPVTDLSAVSDDELRAELERRRQAHIRLQTERQSTRKREFKNWLLAHPVRRFVHKCTFERFETFVFSMIAPMFFVSLIFDVLGLEKHVSEGVMSGITQSYLLFVILVGLVGWIGGTLNLRAFRRERPDLHADN